MQGFAEQRLSAEVAQDHIAKAHEKEQAAGEALLEADDHKKHAYKYMKAKGISHLDVEYANTTLRLQSTSRATVKYDIGALKMQLDDDIIREVVAKRYVVVDFEMFKEIMKAHGVPAKAIRACLEVTEVVDSKRMDELFNAGYITVEDLKGTYTLSETTSLKIKELAK